MLICTAEKVCIVLQQNQKVHWGSCTALQKLKLNCAFCDELLGQVYTVRKIMRVREEHILSLFWTEIQYAQRITLAVHKLLVE